MIKVQIDNLEQELSSLTESWLHEQIINRQKDGIPVCVRVLIKTESINLVLSSGNCTNFGSSDRQPSTTENKIFDSWEELNLGADQINSNSLVVFLKKIKSISR